MSYNRVIPRDLFNEANLLKCIGQLALLIHDGNISNITVEHVENAQGFNIEQYYSSGDLYVSNIQFVYEGHLLAFNRPLNSREPWPLLLETVENTYEVFNDKGEYILNLLAIEELN